jgi:hypothetical protein
MPENTQNLYELMRTYQEMSVRTPIQSKCMEFIKYAADNIRTAVSIEPSNTKFKQLMESK